jgi:hypothetical protein
MEDSLGFVLLYAKPNASSIAVGLDFVSSEILEDEICTTETMTDDAKATELGQRHFEAMTARAIPSVPPRRTPPDVSGLERHPTANVEHHQANERHVERR